MNRPNTAKLTRRSADCLRTFCLQYLRYERRSPKGTNSRANASGSAVETQPTIWTTWQHSPEDTFFITAISSRKFSTSRTSAPPIQPKYKRCSAWINRTSRHSSSEIYSHMFPPPFRSLTATVYGAFPLFVCLAMYFLAGAVATATESVPLYTWP